MTVPVPEATAATRWADLAEPRRDAWYGFLRTHADATRRLDADLRARTGVTFGEYDVLVTLAAGPAEGRRMRQLGEAVVLSPSGVTRIVARLEADGLVERVAENQRIVRARLTAAGVERLALAVPIHLAGVQELFLDALDDDEAAVLAALWRRLGR